MIAAGFFCCNVEDRVICIYCNLICQQWSGETDDPCEVHRTLSAHCPYVQSKLIRRENEETTSGDGVSVNTYPTTRSSQPSATREDDLRQLVKARLDLPYAQRLTQDRFKLSIVRRCIEDQLQLKRKQPKSCDDISIHRFLTDDDFCDDTDLFMACRILQRQIEQIKGSRENIVVPSVRMERFRNDRERAGMLVALLKSPCCELTLFGILADRGAKLRTATESSDNSADVASQSIIPGMNGLETANDGLRNNPCTLHLNGERCRYCRSRQGHSGSVGTGITNNGSTEPESGRFKA